MKNLNLFSEFQIGSTIQLDQIVGGATYTVLQTVTHYEGPGGGTVEQRRWDGGGSGWYRPDTHYEDGAAGLPPP